jgi:hypothetical protein
MVNANMMAMMAMMAIKLILVEASISLLISGGLCAS